jgi:hypothetical protein
LLTGLSSANSKRSFQLDDEYSVKTPIKLEFDARIVWNNDHYSKFLVWSNRVKEKQWEKDRKKRLISQRGLGDIASYQSSIYRTFLSSTFTQVNMRHLFAPGTKDNHLSFITNISFAPPSTTKALRSQSKIDMDRKEMDNIKKQFNPSNSTSEKPSPNKSKKEYSFFYSNSELDSNPEIPELIKSNSNLFDSGLSDPNLFKKALSGSSETGLSGGVSVTALSGTGTALSRAGTGLSRAGTGLSGMDLSVSESTEDRDRLGKLTPSVSRFESFRTDNISMLNTRENSYLNSFQSLLDDDNDINDTKNIARKESNRYNSISEPSGHSTKNKNKGNDESQKGNDDNSVNLSVNVSIANAPILIAEPTIDEIFGISVEWIGVIKSICNMSRHKNMGRNDVNKSYSHNNHDDENSPKNTSFHVKNENSDKKISNFDEFWSNFDHNPIIVEAAVGFIEIYPPVPLVPILPPSLYKKCLVLRELIDDENELYDNLNSLGEKADKLKIELNRTVNTTSIQVSLYVHGYVLSYLNDFIYYVFHSILILNLKIFENN